VFFEPIPLPGKRKPLVTLRDAVNTLTGLPRKEQNAEHWRPAATLLATIGEKGGCMFFCGTGGDVWATQGVRDQPVFDQFRKTTHWGKRTLKRDE
jgi:hypothetical protein